MLKTLKQARAAISLLNPDDIVSRARRPLDIGLVASSVAAYDEMEEYLLPPSLPLEERTYLLDRVHRVSDSNTPPSVDLILFEEGIDRPNGTYTFHRGHPADTAAEILKANPDIELALARQFPPFRHRVVEETIHAVSTENALFALATALPDIVPSLIELPWAFTEFASDTVFLTGNQVRMAFLIAAAHGKEVGLVNQKGAVLSIAAGAFGWRALARELVGKIPLGGGLIPKAAIAYAGTYAVGKSLEFYYRGNGTMTRRERRSLYRDALDRGREVAASAAQKSETQSPSEA
ncbi:MAG TPA: hypothetical protein VMB03_04315 [Bryobacteraceae bacterium]|nr:hypothetical protein [Bryobacteraceae bacterium]